MLLHTRCHTARELRQGVLVYFRNYIPSLRYLAVRSFLFGTDCALQFYSRLVSMPLLGLFFDHSH